MSRICLSQLLLQLRLIQFASNLALCSLFSGSRRAHRLGVVPHFSSGIVERAKRERAWKSPHARKGDTRPAPRRVSPFLAWGDFHARSRFAYSTIPEEKWGTTRSLQSPRTVDLLYFIPGLKYSRFLIYICKNIACTCAVVGRVGTCGIFSPFFNAK